MSSAFEESKKKKKEQEAFLGWPYGEWGVSKSTHGTVSHRQRRAKQAQHINKVYVFHM